MAVSGGSAAQGLIAPQVILDPALGRRGIHPFRRSSALGAPWIACETGPGAFGSL
jgi:hypothetical protein